MQAYYVVPPNLSKPAFRTQQQIRVIQPCVGRYLDVTPTVHRMLEAMLSPGHHQQFVQGLPRQASDPAMIFLNTGIPSRPRAVPTPTTAAPTALILL